MSFIIGTLIVLLVIAFLVGLAIWALQKFVCNTSTSTGNRNANTRSIDLLDSSTLRAAIIGFLALLMLVPLALVGEIVNERSYRYQSVISDIASTWGEAQTLLSPVILVPYQEQLVVQESYVDNLGVTHHKDKTITYDRTAHFLPQSLDIQLDLSHDFRQRGIFESLVYSANVSIEASFNDFDVDSLSDNITAINWDKAWIAIGLSDTRAINTVDSFTWNSTETVLSPGTRLTDLPSGFHSMIDLKKDESSDNPANNKQSSRLSLVMNIKGSGSFNFAPFGENTTVSMRSTWPHPSFQGNALPDSHAISSDGFSAQWEIPHLARNYAQRWSSAEGPKDLYEFTAGVSMFEPISLYSQTTRAIKYGILFIGLTFLTLFIFEMTIQKKLHVIQYGLIGISLCVFFLVLLSLSEHITFIRAYIAASTLTITMITCYTWAVLKNLHRAGSVFTMLVALYAILFSLLRLEDYALLTGTALLVFVVMVLMFVTRDMQRKSLKDA